MFFVPSWSSNAFIFYRIQALCLSVSNFRTSRTMNISLRLCSSEQTNGSTSTKNKTVVYSLIVRLSVHVNLLFLLFRNPLLLQRYNSKHWVTKIRSLWRYAESTKFINTGTFTHTCSWPRKISISVKNKLSQSTSTEVITFNSSVLSLCYRGWPLHAWLFPRIDRPIRTLHWFTFIAQSNDSKEYYQRDLGSERLRDCTVLDLSRNIWNFMTAISWLCWTQSSGWVRAFDSLVYGNWRMIVCDRVIWQTTP